MSIYKFQPSYTFSNTQPRKSDKFKTRTIANQIINNELSSTTNRMQLVEIPLYSKSLAIFWSFYSCFFTSFFLLFSFLVIGIYICLVFGLVPSTLPLFLFPSPPPLWCNLTFFFYFFFDAHGNFRKIQWNFWCFSKILKKWLEKWDPHLFEAIFPQVRIKFLMFLP